MQSHPLPTLALILILFFTLIALILYLRTLQDALEKCATGSRTMNPRKVWLMLIPLFGMVWQFINVINVAKSLRNEFTRVGIACSEAAPGQTIGLAMCVCSWCSLIPLVGGFAGLAGIVLWVAHWFRIANYSRLLDAHHAIAP